MGHVPRRYTNVGKKEARIAADAKASRIAIKRLQEQMEALKKQKAQPAPAPAPAPPPPKEQSMAIEPVKHSPEIENSKNRVNSYENKSKSSISAWEQAQANIQSSFIKPTSSNVNQKVDFSSDTFEANQSSKPNEQAQAAQNQMQNYISKYSQSKSST